MAVRSTQFGAGETIVLTDHTMLKRDTYFRHMYFSVARSTATPQAAHGRYGVGLPLAGAAVANRHIRLLLPGVSGNPHGEATGS